MGHLKLDQKLSLFRWILENKEEARHGTITRLMRRASEELGYPVSRSNISTQIYQMPEIGRVPQSRVTNIIKAPDDRDVEGMLVEIQKLRDETSQLRSENMQIRSDFDAFKKEAKLEIGKAWGTIRKRVNNEAVVAEILSEHCRKFGMAIPAALTSITKSHAKPDRLALVR